MRDRAKNKLCAVVQNHSFEWLHRMYRCAWANIQIPWAVTHHYKVTKKECNETIVSGDAKQRQIVPCDLITGQSRCVQHMTHLHTPYEPAARSQRELVKHHPAWVVLIYSPCWWCTTTEWPPAAYVVEITTYTFHIRVAGVTGTQTSYSCWRWHAKSNATSMSWWYFSVYTYCLHLHLQHKGRVTPF